MATPSEHAASYVFLSYASADRERALHVADRLEATGISVWVDRKSIAGGTSWSAEIVRGIRECVALVVACSVAAMASPNVQQEIQLAWEARRPILPLLLEPVTLPDAVQYALAGRQWIEVGDRPDETWIPLCIQALTGLGAVAERQPDAPVDPGSGRPGSPAAPSPSVRPLTNLPAQTTRFIGRAREVALACQELRRPEIRLLTLIGPGGVGKTRLSLAVAAQLAAAFPDGVTFVPLAPITDPTLVAPTIAQALGVRESGPRPVLDTVLSFLGEKRCLLVLDNFEQILGAGSVVGQLLAGCPGVKVLVTSRSALRVYGEQEFPVDPLALPVGEQLPPLDQLAQYDAISLFAERARAVKPDFALSPANGEAVTAICRRLDGLPLAIELAAARVRLFPPAALLSRLDHRLTLLTGGSRDLPARQQTLRSAIAWSYELLDEGERRLFRRLSVFVGGFDLASAEAVGSAVGELGIDLVDGLDSLVGKSLVRTKEGADEPTFLLLETIREYGLERLAESGEAERVREAHAAYFLNLAEEAATHDGQMDWPTWLDHLAAVADNLRAALDFLLTTRDTARSLRLATAMQGYWFARGSRREGRDRLSTVLALPGSPTISRLRARAFEAVSELARHQTDFAVATSYDTEAVELYGVLGDQASMVRALARLGSTRNNLGDYAEARRALEEGLSIARQIDDPAALLFVLVQFADSATDQEDVDTAKALLAEGLPLARRFELWDAVAWNLWEEGRLATLSGDATRALALYDESLAICRRIESPSWIAFCVYGLAYLASQRGDRVEAWRLIVEGLAIGRERVVPQAIIYGLEQAAVLAVVQGQPDRAARLAGAATALRRLHQYTRHPIMATFLRRAGVPIERPTEAREAAAWDASQVLTQEQAIAYALEENGA